MTRQICFANLPRILLFTLALCSSTRVRADTLNVELKDNLITIEAVNASLIAIADRVSKLTGIPISYTDGSDSLITEVIFYSPIHRAAH